MNGQIIGVDIGGTKIASGVVAPDGSVKCARILPTKAEDGFESSLKQLYRSIDAILEESAEAGQDDIGGIGVCAPGPLNPDKGIVYNPPNLPGWVKVPLTELLQKRYDKPVSLENDANAAGLAEVLWGAAQGYRHVFYVTVSTGIGTAVVIDGKVYHGKNGMAGEGGHVSVDIGGEVRCNCGTPGCIESMASGRAVERQFNQRIAELPEQESLRLELGNANTGTLTMKDIAKAAESGIQEAVEVFQRQGRMLGVWLGSMISLLDPEIIVIGGGVSMAGELLLKPLREAIPHATINMFASSTPVVQAKLKENVGICGAAASFIGRSNAA